MSNVTASLAQKWSVMVKADYQQLLSVTKDTMRFKEAAKGFTTVNFTRYGSGFAKNVPAPGGAGQPMNLSSTNIPCPLIAKYADEYSLLFDSDEIQFDDMREIQIAQAGAMARAFDQQTIDALAAASATIVGDGTAVASYSQMTKIVRTLSDNNAYQRQKAITWLITPQIQEDLLNDTNFIDNNFISMQLAQSGSLEGVKVQGLTFRVIADFTRGADTYGLPTASSTIRRSFVYAFDSMGQGVGQDIKTKITHDVEPLFGSLIRSTYNQGVCVVDPLGVVEVKTLKPA